ncbi:MAG: AAA family ATPase, partial [Muribaculaceae bacterium]|nr:AAA family ATPase [Muribaculaceae bacterium]
MEETLEYAIGIQDFRTVREEGYVYVDKTHYIAKLLRSKSRYCFLARPRRFGKSLFLSTLQYFFEGRRELFKGLAVDTMDWDWESYPVLRLDLNPEKYEEKGRLDILYDNAFRKWEKEYDVDHIAGSFSSRFGNIIEAAHKKTGKQVVILVDEYDKPLVANINNKENIGHYRENLSSVYSNFKSSAEHIRLVFLTGVSRFGKLSVFSDLNNLVDLSFLDEYADVCGITEKEMLDNLRIGIIRLAEKEGIGQDYALLQLKKNYDGYRFSKNGSDIYNPWSLLNAMKDSDISNFWNDTGLPKIVAETLKRVNADLESMF